MKNVLKLKLIILTSLLFISCSNDDMNNENLNSENEKKFEILRENFAQKYSESAKEIDKDLKKFTQSSSKSSISTLTYEEFIGEIPDSENLTYEAKILLEPAFSYAKEEQDIKEFVDSFGADELYSLAMLFESWADENLTEEEAINKLLYVVGNDFQNKSDCKFFCKVWNGIKKAAKWVWGNYKEISALLGAAGTLYKLISGW